MAIKYPTDYSKIADLPADLKEMAESIQEELDNKVDKDPNKDLSTNDYTTSEKQKLAGIETGATKTTIDGTLSSTSTNPVQNKKVYEALAEKQSQIDALVEELEIRDKQIPTGHAKGSSIKLEDSAGDMPIKNAVIWGDMGQEILPEEYQQVEYIESTGTQYIDTGRLPTLGDKIKMSYIATGDDSKGVYGAWDTNISASRMCIWHNVPKNKINIGFGSSADLCPISNIDFSNKLEIEAFFGSEKQYLRVGSNVVESSDTSYQNQTVYNAIIFGRNQSTRSLTSIKLFSCEIYNENTLLRNYIPCYRKSDNVVGLYDLVNNVFYTNSGTGTFEKGNDVPNLNVPLEVHCVTGTCNVNFKNEDMTLQQNAPLTLGNIELYDGDKIQISYVNQAGYKKVTGASIIQSMQTSISWRLGGTQNFEDSKAFWSNSKDAKTTSDKVVLCSHLLTVTNVFSRKDIGIQINSSKEIGVRIPNEIASTLAEFNSWISNNNVKFAYSLESPITTEITDETLLAQLETLINMKTYKGITHFDTEGEDLAPVIEFDYYKDMTTYDDRISALEARIELLEE